MEVFLTAVLLGTEKKMTRGSRRILVKFYDKSKQVNKK
jgi:hypothetical protein